MSNFKRTERYIEAMVPCELVYGMMDEDNETCVVSLVSQYRQNGKGNSAVQ